MRRTARVAGLVYVAFAILSLIGFFYVPGRFDVAGDAAATARRITDDPSLYRFGIFSALLGQILFVVLAVKLYELFEGVDRAQARLMVALVCVGVAAEVAALAFTAAPLVLLGGAGYLTTFPESQLETLAYGFSRIGGSLGQIVTAFWGAWLFPFGVLTIRSRFFPRALGYLLFLSGAAYCVTCVTAILLPSHLRTISQLMTPLYFGEFVMVLWLPVMGARVPQPT